MPARCLQPVRTTSWACLQQNPELVRVSSIPPWLPGVLTEKGLTHTHDCFEVQEPRECLQPAPAEGLWQG